jgi:hypothetical protein
MKQKLDSTEIGAMAQQSQKRVTPKRIWMCLSAIKEPQNGRFHAV